MEEDKEKPKILIVEDKRNLGKTFSDILKAKGYSPFAVLTGKEGVAAAKEDDFSLALIDLKLSDIPGIEVLKEIKKNSPRTEVIILTAYASLDTAMEAVNLGAFSYQEKPYNMERLLLDIRRALERQWAEDALRASEKKYHELVDTSVDGVISVDSQMKIILWNPGAERIFGYTEKDMLWQSVIKITPERYRKAQEKGFAEFRKNGSGPFIGKTLELEGLRKDGTEFPLELSVSSRRMGEKYIATAIIRDITERKRAEEEVKKSRKFLDTIIENIPDPLYIKDRQFRLVEVNKAFCHTHKDTKGEILGKPRYRETDDEVFKTGKKLEIPEQHYTDAEGNQHWTHLKKVPLTDESGNITHVLTISSDISERKQAEEKIQASLREKEVLLKEIHHRVKNNLQIISSLLNLQSEHIEDEHASELFKISQNRIDSMALIHEELYKSKDLARIDFADYIQKLVSELYSSYGVDFETIKQNINAENILLDIDKAIPCGLIINELVSNSLKYAFSKGKGGTIQITMHPLKGNKIELIISDDGIGFPKDLDFRNTETLGMQLVVTLTNQLEGTIELDRSGGTTFNITFTE